MPASSPPILRWRLQEVMETKDIKFASTLQEALSAYGILVSSSCVSRLVYSQPKRIDFLLLQGLCAVLNCTPNDLYGHRSTL